MIRRYLLTAALILVGSAAMAPKTMAQTVDVPFTGNVGGACTFGTVTPGTLGVDSPTNPTSLAAGYSGGAMGKVSVSCNSPAHLIVSQPVQTGGPTFTPTASEGYVNAPSGSTSSVSGAPLTLSTTGTPTLLNVDAHVVKGSPLAPGTYNYKVTLTITP